MSDPDAASSNEEDILCMGRLSAGEDLALNEIMARWKRPLAAFCYRYTGNAADAREITQETFVKVYHARARYRPEAKFSTWLFAIAANLCKMRARWKSRHPELLDADRCPDAPDDGPATTAQTPADEAERNELADALQRSILTLPHPIRTAFVLREIEGQSYRDIAAVLGCTEKAVDRRLAKAKEQLRERIRADLI